MADAAPVFDRYAGDYRNTVQGAIGLSGESVDYFAELKVGELAARLGGSAPRRLLDFGCGTGTATRVLARTFPACVIDGVDTSAKSVESARNGSDGATAATYSVITEHLPFDDETFDIAFTANVLHHIDRAEHHHWAAELLRVLRRHGRLFVFEHNPFNPGTRWVVHVCPFDEGVTLLRPGYTRRMLRDAGFDARPASFYYVFPRFLAMLRGVESLLRALPLGAQYVVEARRR